jgi:signal transduction histidine kinase
VAVLPAADRGARPRGRAPRVAVVRADRHRRGVAGAHDRRHETDLRLAQRLEAVGQLAAGIAHEINTPIQYVGDTVTFQDAFTDLDRLNAEYRALCPAGADGLADAETRLGPLPPVVCNVGDLNQVFLNVLVNAAHAIEDVAGDGDERGTITVSSHAAGADAVIRIADTGGGIPAEVAGRVFDPFFTTKPVGRGTGQGLAIAHRIVAERHGGTLSFTSAPDRRTVFEIRLPAAGPT